MCAVLVDEPALVMPDAKGVVVDNVPHQFLDRELGLEIAERGRRRRDRGGAAGRGRARVGLLSARGDTRGKDNARKQTDHVSSLGFVCAGPLAGAWCSRAS